MLSFFKKKLSGIPAGASNLPQTNPAPAAPLNGSIDPPKTPDPASPTVLPDELPYQPYQWITDEGLLRDEGTLFGLSGGRIDEKVDAITHFYASQILQAEREIRLSNLEIDEASSDLEQSIRKETEARNKVKEINGFKPVDVQYGFWEVFSFIGFCAVVGCNYFLIYQVGNKAWEYPVVVATGAYLFGIFSLFNKASMLFSSEAATAEINNQVEKWKLLGQEVAVPLVVTIYVAVSGWGYNRPELVLASGLIIFFLFLYAGKALLRQVGFLRIVLNHFINAGKARKWRKQETQKLEEEVATLSDKQGQLKSAIKQLREKQQQIRLPEQIEKDRDTSIKLFESEYKLALESRKVASQINLDRITNLN